MTDHLALDREAFIITKEYRRFAEFCDACQRHRYIGLCYGPPGVGKTLSARRYAQWDLIEPFVPAYLSAPAPSLEARTYHTIIYTPTVATTPRQIAHEIQDLRNTFNWLVEDSTAAAEGREAHHRAADAVELLIVDEADRLKMAGLEQVRDIYDRSRIGVILIGMPGLEKRLARYPQLYSRVGFAHPFRSLSAEEVRFIVETHWQQLGLPFAATDFTDTEALAAIIRITSGNFRLLQRLFTQIERILQINAIRTVTKEVVETARESLVIGVT